MLHSYIPEELGDTELMDWQTIITTRANHSHHGGEHNCCLFCDSYVISKLQISLSSMFLLNLTNPWHAVKLGFVIV